MKHSPVRIKMPPPQSSPTSAREGVQESPPPVAGSRSYASMHLRHLYIRHGRGLGWGRFRSIILSACALLSPHFFSACAPTQNANITVLTYASPYSPMHPFSRADQVWMKWVHDQSNGQLRVQPYWAGSILSSAHSMNEIRHGVVDIGLITPIYARGGAHLIRVQAGFYAGLLTFDQQVAMYKCMARHDPQF